MLCYAMLCYAMIEAARYLSWICALDAAVGSLHSAPRPTHPPTPPPATPPSPTHPPHPIPPPLVCAAAFPHPSAPPAIPIQVAMIPLLKLAFGPSFSKAVQTQQVCNLLPAAHGKDCMTFDADPGPGLWVTAAAFIFSLVSTMDGSVCQARREAVRALARRPRPRRMSAGTQLRSARTAGCASQAALPWRRAALVRARLPTPPIARGPRPRRDSRRHLGPLHQRRAPLAGTEANAARRPALPCQPLHTVAHAYRGSRR